MGVKYIYEEMTTEEKDNQIEKPLTTEDLKIMPITWLLRLYQAAIEADDGEVMPIIKEIPETEGHLAKSLTKLVHQYEFDQIIDLIEALINNE